MPINSSAVFYSFILDYNFFFIMLKFKCLTDSGAWAMNYIVGATEIVIFRFLVDLWTRLDYFYMRSKTYFLQHLT